MDEATLTIRFRDESSPTGGGPGVVSPQSAGVVPGSTLAADTQDAITQAGGIQQHAAKGNQPTTGGPPPAVAPAPVPAAAPLAVPPVATGQPTSGDPLLKTVQGIVAADPAVSIAELQKALGIQAGRAQTLLNAAGIQPGGQQAPAQTQPAPTSPLPVPAAQPAAVPPTQATPPAPTPPVAPPPIAATAQQQTANQSAPPPVVNPPGGQQTQGPTGAGVQATVNAIAGLAARGGPLGAAAGRVATAAAAIPGVGSAIAAAAPAVATAAPFVALGAAALAVPAAAALAVNSIFNEAREQTQGLSPEVAQAEAQARVRDLMTRLRTAERLGDEIAEGVTVRSRLSSAIQGLNNITAEPVLDDFNRALRGAATILESIGSFAERHSAAIQNVENVMLWLAGFKLPAMVLGAIGGEEAKSLAHDNPLTFYQSLPMPTLPPPFTGDEHKPIDVEFSRMPGL